jgi:hypothetical protein
MTDQISFVQYMLPPIESGSYKVTVTQTLAVGGVPLQTFTGEQLIAVSGVRTGIAASGINAVFPPANSQGEFANTLPHVVLTNASLPWQRTPFATPVTPAPDGPAPSWLAVLLFDQADPPPAVTAGTLNDLIAPPAGTFCPAFAPQPGETATNPVSYIDVPLTLFNAIAPSADDLGWLAHVRTVDSAGKAAGGSRAQIAGADGSESYAVVFGNRLPVAGHQSMAALVSLEGFAAALPSNTGAPGGISASTYQTVRMACLQSWSFTAVSLAQSFAGLLTAIDAAALQMPFSASEAAADTQAGAIVQSAFGMGYTAMNHALENDDRTVSWFRGPFLPIGGATPACLDPPYGSPDQLLRYDPTTGMFDVSYAAAWQLGQLLALQNGAFASALYRWKLTQTEAAVRAAEIAVLDRQLPAAAGGLTVGGLTAGGRIGAALGAVLAPAATKLSQP